MWVVVWWGAGVVIGIVAAVLYLGRRHSRAFVQLRQRTAIELRQREDALARAIGERGQRFELQEKLEAHASASPGALYSLRRTAEGQISLPFATPQVRDVFGLDPADLIADASGALDRIHPNDLARVRDGLEESARDMTTWHAEFRVNHPDRGTIWVEGRSSPVAQPDGSILWHGFFFDVAERHRLEEELRQSQKMEAISQLAGGVAHDFNNLLTVILGNAALLPGHASSDAAEPAREIQRAADRAAGLTRQLLYFARRQVLHPVRLDLNEVVSTTTQLLRRLLGDRVTLETELAPDLPTILADPGMLQQVLLNLSVNARDAMPEGGSLVVSTSVQVDSQRPAMPGGPARRAVCLSISDSGIGMTDDVKARIFEPYFTTKVAGKGTGLGLATVYGIVQQHGGTITCTSEVGAGTTFRIVLPADTAARPGTGASVPAAVGLSRGEAVLVVEDEPAVRELTASVLRQAGYRVLTAESGYVALDVWRAHRESIDLLFTDIVMPQGMSGPQLANAVLAEAPELPVIFTSGYSAEANAAGFVLEQGVNFLRKPYQLGALVRVVRLALDRRMVT